MNCPECGRFMILAVFEDVGKDPWECYQWWVCPEAENHDYQADPIPAPEYQWLRDCEGIPFDALLDWPELFAEYTELWNRLPRRYQKIYRQYSPALVTR